MHHRKGELASIRSSGASADELSKLEILLINVAKLEEAKPDKKLISLFSKKGRDEAEAERAKALEEVDTDSSGDEHTKKSKDDDEVKDEDFEFDSKKGRFPGGKHSNPKKDLVNYLEKKNKKDATLREEELRVREEEMENKSKELEIMRLKTEADIEERKKITDLLLKLANPKNSE